MPSEIFRKQMAATGLIEGGYSNDPSDRGGETNHGITIGVARAYGYNGSMRDLTKELALEIYEKRYYSEPGFAAFEPIFPALAAWLLDTGINMGQNTAGAILQRNLNVLNNGGVLYGDLKEDGRCGSMTRAALQAYIAHRGVEGKRRLLEACEALQWARYADIMSGNSTQERFAYGWLGRAFD